MIHLRVAPDVCCVTGTFGATVATVSHMKLDCHVYVLLFNTSKVLTVA